MCGAYTHKQHMCTNTHTHTHNHTHAQTSQHHQVSLACLHSPNVWRCVLRLFVAALDTLIAPVLTSVCAGSTLMQSIVLLQQLKTVWASVCLFEMFSIVFGGVVSTS